MRAPPPHTVREFKDYPAMDFFKVQNDIYFKDRLLSVIKFFMSNKIKLFKNSVQLNRAK